MLNYIYEDGYKSMLLSEADIISTETKIPHRRTTFLIGDRHSLSKTKIPFRRPTFIIEDLHSLSETKIPYRRRTFLIKDRHSILKTDIPHRRPLEKTFSSKTNFWVPNCCILHPLFSTNLTIDCMSVSDEKYWFSFRHLQWVSVNNNNGFLN